MPFEKLYEIRDKIANSPQGPGWIVVDGVEYRVDVTNVLKGIDIFFRALNNAESEEQ